MNIAIIGVGYLGEWLIAELFNEMFKTSSCISVNNIYCIVKESLKKEPIKDDLIHKFIHHAKYSDPYLHSYTDFIDKHLHITSSYECMKEIDIVITCYGAYGSENIKDRVEWLIPNYDLTKNIINNMKEHGLKNTAYIINAVNPVDIITWQIQELSGLSQDHVIGISGTVDITRFAQAIKSTLQVNYQDIDLGSLLVVGEHGENMVPLLSHAIVRGKALLDQISEKQEENIIEYTKKKGIQMRENAKGISPHHTPAIAVLTILKTIINKENKNILASMYNSRYGVCIGSLVNFTHGKPKLAVLNKMNNNEEQKLLKAVEKIKELKHQINAHEKYKSSQITLKKNKMLIEPNKNISQSNFREYKLVLPTISFEASSNRMIKSISDKMLNFSSIFSKQLHSWTNNYFFNMPRVHTDKVNSSAGTNFKPETRISYRFK